jgi:hypothetical protein
MIVLNHCLVSITPMSIKAQDNIIIKTAILWP